MSYNANPEYNNLAVVTTRVRDEAFFGFAEGLIEFGYDLTASEGTAKALQTEGIPATTFSELIQAAAPTAPIPDREGQGLYLATQISNEKSKLGAAIGLVCVGLNPEKRDPAGTSLLAIAIERRRLVVSRPSEYGRVLDRLTEGSIEQGLLDSLGRMAAYDLSNHWVKHSRFPESSTSPS